MSNYNYKTGIIYLNFVGISKDCTYVYRNPTIEPSEVKPKNSEAKSLFESIFGKKKITFLTQMPKENLLKFLILLFLFLTSF